jgi:hypothetical protein
MRNICALSEKNTLNRGEIARIHERTHPGMLVGYAVKPKVILLVCISL